MSFLEVKNLSVSLRSDTSLFPLVQNVSFELNPGETLGFVGESGSGKSLTSLSLLDLLPEALEIKAGFVKWEGQSLMKMSPIERQSLRGRTAAMIFQNPLSALHPCYTIREQIFECFKLGGELSSKMYFERAVQLLKEVGILEPEQRMRAYPHELSGGMAQRVVIAMALARNPKVLVADEPTTALDVTIQAQVLRKMRELQRERGLAMIMVSHDLGVIAHMTQKILVFYAGQVVEAGETRRVLTNPRHPYTRALLRCRPQAHTEQFPFISGQVPAPSTWTDSCRFAGRCENVKEQCKKSEVELVTDHKGAVRCLSPLNEDKSEPPVLKNSEPPVREKSTQGAPS